MSIEPQIIKRVRSRPSRIRDESPPPNDAIDDSPATTPDTLATKLKNKQKRAKPKSRLSFGTDDQVSSDAEVFKVKKSNLSRRVILGSASSSPGVSIPSNLDQATISTGPSYTKDYLKELKANTPSTPAVRPPISQTDFDASFDISFDIEGAVVENADSFGETAIPSASAITAAKEKRGRLRGTEEEEGFISLSVSKHGDLPKGPHPESRLMREEDELGEGEEDMAEFTGAQERIALGKKARKAQEWKRRMGMVEMIEDAEEEDEETIEWEKAQLRRVGPVDGDRDESLRPRKVTYTPAPIPSVTPIPTLSAAVGRLTGSLTVLTSSHATHTATLSSLAEEQAALESKQAEMREMIEKAERKRGWFSAFREWVESVANFLDEKYPHLDKLEDEHVSLLTERYEMVSKRRRLDDEDDVALFLGVHTALRPESMEETDELGRIVPSQNVISAQRASRRSARSKRRVLRRARNQAAQEEEGYSTDSSLPTADADDFRTALNKLHQRRGEVLSDVRADDFRDPQLGLAKWFGEWRELYEESYVGAWGGLGLVAAWEFWCRLEVVGWDPIEDASRSLDSFEWSATLHEYSRPRNGTNMVDEDDEPDIGPGGDMVSSMISQAIIPRLSKLIEGGAFDPYSARHTRHIIGVAEQVEASVEEEGLRFQSLLQSVLMVFREAVISTQSLLAPSLHPSSRGPPFDPQSLPARRRFLLRRLKLLTNLLKWRKYTGERFRIGEVATLLVRDCILPVAERGWEVGGEELLRKAVEKMPKKLVPVEVTKLIA